MKLISNKFTLFFLAGTLLFSLTFCKKKKKEETEESFDKQGMLANIAANTITSNYLLLQISLDTLIAKYDKFKSTGNLSDFQVVKQKFNEAYVRYQAADMFEFGPAETAIIRMNCNVFPTDTVQIKSNISSGSYDLQAASNFDAKGFPALDYLFYGYNQTEQNIVQTFTASATRKQYVSDLLAEMRTKISTVFTQWNNGYYGTFITSLGTDVGSSIGFLVNQINFELDYLKNAKIGTPLGKKTLGVPAPETCESFYGGQSVKLAIETFNLIDRVYYGKDKNGVNGIGFDDYLDHIKAEYNGQPLTTAISNQFNITRTKLTALNDPLSQQVLTNAAQVDAAYSELVKLLVLLKTDMPSQLGVVITYQDGDGD